MFRDGRGGHGQTLAVPIRFTGSRALFVFVLAVLGVKMVVIVLCGRGIGIDEPAGVAANDAVARAQRMPFGQDETLAVQQLDVAPLADWAGALRDGHDMAS